MSDITDWEPLAENPLTDSQSETYWQRQYGKGLEHIENLLCELENLKKQVSDYEATREHQRELMIEAANNHRAAQSRVDSLTRDKKQLQDKFTSFKADAITSLKAIDLCILASLCTDNQWLTHKARNFRMRHVHQIICNEVASLGDRKLSSYEDDF
jgi:hypothetical protein